MRPVSAGLTVLAVILGTAAVPPRREAGPIHCGIEMRNVSLHLAENVVLHVRAIDGEFISHRAGQPPVFDDPNSYTLRMRSGDLAMDGPSLSAVANQALEKHGAPIRDITIAIGPDAVRVSGSMHKAMATVPFEMTASVGVTPEGLMRFHATTVKAAHVPVKRLLDLLGLDVGDLAKMPKGSGIRADGDDLLMDAAAMLPPPRTEGRLERVAIHGDRLEMHMAGDAHPPARPATLPLPSAPNYLYFFGGSIQFGKLTMTDADMQLIDADPRDPFDFYPAKYERQLIAGYSHNTPRKGLQVFMPDYGRSLYPCACEHETLLRQHSGRHRRHAAGSH